MYTEKTRKPFTPNWDTSMDSEMALPIKMGNQVIPVMRKTKRKVDADAAEERIIADDDEIENDNGEATPEKRDDSRKVKVIDMEIDLTIKSNSEQNSLKQTIAEMCTAITAHPEESVLKKGGKVNSSRENPDFITYSVKDLLGLCSTKDPVQLELLMVSITLVFKDICPGYRIRGSADGLKDEDGNVVQLKKETKRLYDFERNLLHYYQQFLFVLDKRAAWGLGKVRVDGDISPVYLAAKRSLGLTALRCQCELLKGLVHFNFRTLILNSIVSRVCSLSSLNFTEESGDEQMRINALNIAGEAIEYIIRHDANGEISYEFIMLMNKILKATKSTLAPRILQCLESVKVTVKADDAYLLKIRAKQQKKKRKTDDSKVEAGLMEADLVSDDVSKKRFQVNSLQEMSLLYFRILKMKPTEPNQRVLLPMALGGLGRITHLINVDHVIDLMTILRGILDQGGSFPVSVRLLCVVCALKTLSGPGELLQIDDEPYLKHFHQVLLDLPKRFDDWVGVFDTTDVYFIQRREEKMPIVEKTILLLTMLATSHLDSQVGCTLLTLAHTLLLRYPRVRQSMALWQYAVLLLSSTQTPKDILSGKVKVKIIESAAAAALLLANARSALAATSMVVSEEQHPVGRNNKNNNKEPRFFEEDGRMEDLAMRGLFDATVTLNSGTSTHAASSSTGKKKLQQKKVKRTKQQKRLAQRAHSGDDSIANMYSLLADFEGLDIREQMVRLLAMVLVKSSQHESTSEDGKKEEEEDVSYTSRASSSSSSSPMAMRFRRIVNAMCQHDLVPLPLNREDLEGSYEEILARSQRPNLNNHSKRNDSNQHQQQSSNNKKKNASNESNNTAVEHKWTADNSGESRRVVSFVDTHDDDEEDDDNDEDDDDREDGKRGSRGANSGKNKNGRGNNNNHGKKQASSIAPPHAQKKKTVQFAKGSKNHPQKNQQKSTTAGRPSTPRYNSQQQQRGKSFSSGKSFSGSKRR